ncbi:MAG: lycopene cyclase, partial [Bacteroidetes bacterium]|nr:lycopene cyclase [Bacteroidota bacterium]
GSLKEAMAGSINLKQHFKGWVVETSAPAFDPEQLRLFDFRTPQLNSLCFFYVIPQNPQRALVEYTLFSDTLLPPEAYDTALQAYIAGVLKLGQYQIVDTEWGVIPMSTFSFPQKQGQHIFNIGSLGGASKPSTGYTFRRIQQQCQSLVQQLESGVRSFKIFSPARFKLYDAALLNILDKKGAQGEEVFARLFQKNPVPRLLKFLDEETNPGEELLLMNTVDKPLFLKSLLNLATGLPFR